MCLNDFNSVIIDALKVKPENVNYEQTLSSLRQFRSTIVTQGADFQLAAFNHDSLIDNLVEFIDRMSKFVGPNSLASFNVGVQCLANLTSDNDSTRTIFSQKHCQTVVDWLKLEGAHSKNYVSAVLLNVDQVNCLDRLWGDADFVRLLIDVAQTGAVFGVLLLQNVIQRRSFASFYEFANETQKSFLLQLLESMINKSDRHVDDVFWTATAFKKYCDRLMLSISDISQSTATELALMLDLLAAASHRAVYMEAMQKDRSLLISASYFLRGIHDCFDKNKSWKETQKEAVELLTNQNDDKLTTQPFFGVKGNLIRLLGNLSYKNEQNQNEIREAGCLPIILDSCKLDGRNPFVREWSILAIRNLAENNSNNQQFIEQMTLQGLDGDLILNDKLSLTLNQDGVKLVNVAPLIRR